MLGYPSEKSEQIREMTQKTHFFQMFTVFHYLWGFWTQLMLLGWMVSAGVSNYLWHSIFTSIIFGTTSERSNHQFHHLHDHPLKLWSNQLCDVVFQLWSTFWSKKSEFQKHY